MALQYDTPQSVPVDDITSGMSNLSEDTRAAINQLLPAGTNATVENYHGGPVTPGTQIALVPSGEKLKSDPGTPIVIMSDGATAKVTFGADSEVQTLILGSGNNTVKFKSNNDITVETLGGNDSIVTGGGNDHLTINGGHATVNTGEGNDVVALVGNGEYHVAGGSGDMVVNLDETAEGTATVDAGDGFDRINLLKDNPGNHEFGFNAKTGEFTMHSPLQANMFGVDVVSFDVDGNGQIRLEEGDHITVLATNAQDSLVAKLYKIALGREAIDGDDGWGDSTLGGINWWMNEFEKGETDGTMEHLVNSFLNCDEFHDKYDAMNNAEYVDALLANLYPDGRDVSEIAANYLKHLNSGAMDRVEVAWDLAESTDAVELLGNDGAKYVIDGF